MDNSTSFHHRVFFTSTAASISLTTDAGVTSGVALEEVVTAGVVAGVSAPGVGAVNLAAVTKAFSAYILLLMIINVSLNGLVIFAVLYLQRGRYKSSQLVLLQLSISDLLIAILYLPFLLVLLLRDSDEADCRMLCAALAALERGLIAASIWGIAFVSLDRYLYIVKHNSYKTSMTLRRSVGGAIAVWVIALIFGTTSFLVSADSRDDSGACVCHLTLDFYGFYHLLYSAGYITLCFILPTTLMLVFYGFVMRVAQRRATGFSKNPFRKAPDRTNIRYSPTGRGKGMCPLQQGSGSSGQSWNQGNDVHLHKVKAARILFVVITLYIACITPYFVINIALATGHWNPRGFPYVVYLGSILLLHSNSSCNPLFYGFANRRLRTTLTEFIRRKMGRPGVFSKAEYHTQRGRANSRISIMGESSDCSSVINGGLARRVSQSSDISALSCMSREAFVGRDLLDIYTSGHGNGPDCTLCSGQSGDGTEDPPPASANCPCRTRTVTDPSSTPITTQSLQGSQHVPAQVPDEEHYWATSCPAPATLAASATAADTPAISSWADPPGDEAETERMIMLTSVGCHALNAPEDHPARRGARGSSMVPIRRPLESKRSNALEKIAEAAMLFSVHEEGGQRDWSSPSPDSVLVGTRSLAPTDSVLAWTTAE